MEKFREMGLSEKTLNVLKKMKIVEPTEIQEKTIPFAIEGRDLIAVSATGSGKTLAFACPIIEKIVPNGKIQSIILTPTRELAEQINDAMKIFAANRLEILPIYGGVSIETQIRRIKSSDVIVGTPGRILDHLDRGSLNLNDVKILVLDEFDRMLDMGFHRDVEKIIKKCPKKRQTLLFSATTSGVEQLLDRYTKDALEINAKSYVDHSKLKQIFYDTPNNIKFSLLVQLLKEEKDSNLVLVFCSTRRNVDFVAENLILNKIKAKAIHGGMEQRKRMRVLKEFHEKGPGVLVCTDVAARGLDIKGVSHVYNYDLPQVVDDYIHRIGRTARAGEEGIAINILSSRDYPIFSDIVNQKKLTISEVELPYVGRAIMERNAGQKKSRGRQDNQRRGASGKNKNIGLYDAICKKCGKKCQVPFKPTKNVGVSCSDCFVKKSGGRNSGKKRDFSRNNSRGNSRRR